MKQTRNSHVYLLILAGITNVKNIIFTGRYRREEIVHLTSVRRMRNIRHEA